MPFFTIILNLNLQEFIRSAEFDRLMNDPLRACSSYPLKIKTAAQLLVIRLVVWDRWDCLIPLAELWQTAKQITSLTSGKNHEWEATFHQVSAGNLDQHVPAEHRQDFVHRFLPDLVDGSKSEWKRAVDQLIDSWSSSVTQASVDLPCITELLIDPHNERRRQTLLSERLWSELVRGFGQSAPSASIELDFSDDEEDSSHSSP